MRGLIVNPQSGKESGKGLELASRLKNDGHVMVRVLEEFRQLGSFGLLAAVIFAVAVFESFVYLIGHGALDWGPSRVEKPREVVSPERTATSTIRRVGLEGREPTPEPSRAA